MEQNMDFIKERYELCAGRVKEIIKEQEVPEKYREFFRTEALFIAATTQMAELVAKGTYAAQPLEKLREWNERLFAKVVPENYETSYANPAYVVKRFGVREGKVLTALSAKLQEIVPYAAKQKLYFQTILMELFLEIYGRYTEYDEFAVKDARAAYKSFLMDYRRDYLEDGLDVRYNPDDTFAKEIISSPYDERNLYRYGAYVT